MLVHVLLYEVGKEDEGIHSIDIKGKTIVIMFENLDDAERYKGLLEAQDFPTPSVEIIEKQEIELFCKEAGYESRLVEKGFLPKTEEDRLLISPPQRNIVEDSNDEELESEGNENFNLEEMKQKLENLL